MAEEIVLFQKKTSIKSLTINPSFFDEKNVVLTYNFGNQGVVVYSFIPKSDTNSLLRAKEIVEECCKKRPELVQADWEIWHETG